MVKHWSRLPRAHRTKLYNSGFVVFCFVFCHQFPLCPCEVTWFLTTFYTRKIRHQLLKNILPYRSFFLVQVSILPQALYGSYSFLSVLSSHLSSSMTSSRLCASYGTTFTMEKFPLVLMYSLTWYWYENSKPHWLEFLSAIMSGLAATLLLRQQFPFLSTF